MPTGGWRSCWVCPACHRQDPNTRHSPLSFNPPPKSPLHLVLQHRLAIGPQCPLWLEPYLNEPRRTRKSSSSTTTTPGRMTSCPLPPKPHPSSPSPPQPSGTKMGKLSCNSILQARARDLGISLIWLSLETLGGKGVLKKSSLCFHLGKKKAEHFDSLPYL